MDERFAATPVLSAPRPVSALSGTGRETSGVVIDPAEEWTRPRSSSQRGSGLLSTAAAVAVGDDRHLIDSGERREHPPPVDGDERMRAAAVFGRLAPYALLPGITDIFVNGDRGLWFDRGHGLIHDPSWALPEDETRALAVSLIARGGRHVDEATPCIDVRLGGDARVHVVVPPVSTAGTLISIRLQRRDPLGIDELAESGMFGDGAAAASVVGSLLAAIHDRANILITGGGGSGKTTLLGALLSGAAAGERVVTVEDVAELRIAHPHVVSLEVRQANLEGAGELGLQRLIREALRMRPDRLVIGECRGAEIRELLSALNTGHDGGAGTMHANTLSDVPARLEALGALAGLGAEAIARQTISAIDLVLHLERRDGRRRLVSAGHFTLSGDGRLAIIGEAL